MGTSAGPKAAIAFAYRAKRPEDEFIADDDLLTERVKSSTSRLARLIPSPS
jgi:hypothetical protein